MENHKNDTTRLVLLLMWLCLWLFLVVPCHRELVPDRVTGKKNGSLCNGRKFPTVTVKGDVVRSHWCVLTPPQLGGQSDVDSETYASTIKNICSSDCL